MLLKVQCHTAVDTSSFQSVELLTVQFIHLTPYRTIPTFNDPEKAFKEKEKMFSVLSETKFIF